MINRIILVWRLTKDPELRKTNNDTAVASFTLAVDTRTKDQDGNRTTTFVTVVVWNQQAENVSKFLRKGAIVGRWLKRLCLRSCSELSSILRTKRRKNKWTS